MVMSVVALSARIWSLKPDVCLCQASSGAVPMEQWNKKRKDAADAAEARAKQRTVLVISQPAQDYVYLFTDLGMFRRQPPIKEAASFVSLTCCQCISIFKH